MNFNLLIFKNRMQTQKKFKQFVESNFNVSNELVSSMMGDVTLVKIEASSVGIGSTNEGVGSHKLANANEQVQLDAFIVEEHQQANAHSM
jgi:hypothetical protein